MKQSLEALRKAKSAKGLSGWERSAEVQNFLVDLLQYLEGKEHLRLFPGERKKCNGPQQQITGAPKELPAPVQA